MSHSCSWFVTPWLTRAWTCGATVSNAPAIVDRLKGRCKQYEFSLFLTLAPEGPEAPGGPLRALRGPYRGLRGPLGGLRDLSQTK